MNTLSKVTRQGWNPFKEMEDIQNSLLGLWERRSGQVESENGVGAVGWSPLVDITEDKNDYLVTAELPGVNREDLKVTVENGVLTVTGERKFEKEDKKYHRVERVYGSFTRSFSLPEDANTESVKAEMKDGVLTLRIAKREEAKPKSIDVKVE